jgi:hypothetical protein
MGWLDPQGLHQLAQCRSPQLRQLGEAFHSLCLVLLNVIGESQQFRVLGGSQGLGITSLEQLVLATLAGVLSERVATSAERSRASIRFDRRRTSPYNWGA